jgi:hypothetical protein
LAQLSVKSYQVGGVVLLQAANLAQQKNRPTPRAPDPRQRTPGPWWWAFGRFLNLSLASDLYCSQAESTPAHLQFTQTVSWISLPDFLSVSGSDQTGGLNR